MPDRAASTGLSGALRRPGGTEPPRKVCPIHGFSCRYLRSRWRQRQEQQNPAPAPSLQASLGENAGRRLDRSRLPQRVDRRISTAGRLRLFGLAENVLAFGNPGSGKTHLVCALGQENDSAGAPGSFSTCALLVQRLLRAKIGLTLESELKRLDRFEALIVDDSRLRAAKSRGNGSSLHTAGPSLRTDCRSWIT